ncbi:hypothetical protein ACHABQ_14230, partial [Nesterenkonia aurantiaca]|uniref:hypothetical protein n=1 Tax=Nesterenkonia aurantiaca TaxID=1436010 RepID=UPI003EE7A26C
FLHMGPKALFASAAVFGILSPMLTQNLAGELPAWSSYNPTFIDVLTEPGAVASQLLLTGTYPALPYMAYLLVGLGLGRLDLRETAVQFRVLVVGVGVTIFAYSTSSVLLYALGGYQRLLSTSGMSEYELDQVLIWGPDSLPASTGWWLAITTPHTNTPLAIMASLGVSLMVLGVFLLIAPKVGKWLLPLSAMGAMTFTLYTAHLVALSIEVHYGQPYLWFVIHLVAAAVFAMIWQRSLGQGPLEKVVSTSVKGTRRLVSGAEGQSRASAGGRGSQP